MTASRQEILRQRVSSKATATETKTFDIEVLRKFLRYEPESGKLFWRERGQEWFLGDGFWSGWNKRFAGKETKGTNENGYRIVCLYRKPYLAHRVIWAMAYGEWPDEIDHIDGDRQNNRLANLRSVTSRENARNRKLGKNNKTGHFGIVHLPKKGRTPDRWIIYVCGKRSGRFFSLEEAVAARTALANEVGLHPNHGRAA